MNKKVDLEQLTKEKESTGRIVVDFAVIAEAQSQLARLSFWAEHERQRAEGKTDWNCLRSEIADVLVNLSRIRGFVECYGKEVKPDENNNRDNAPYVESNR